MTTKETVDKMTKELAAIQTFMETGPSDDANILAERLSMANVYIARSGEILAHAKRMQNDAVVAAWEKYGDTLTKMGSTMAQKVLVAYCKDSNFLVDWADRVNRGLVHSCDNLRTLISLAKENMRLTRYADEIENRVFDEEREERW